MKKGEKVLKKRGNGSLEDGVAEAGERPHGPCRTADDASCLCGSFEEDILHEAWLLCDGLSNLSLEGCLPVSLSGSVRVRFCVRLQAVIVLVFGGLLLGNPTEKARASKPFQADPFV